MKIFKLPQLAELSGLAEYVLSAEGSGATALRWGRLLPKETGRKVTPAGTGAEIVYIVKGCLSVKCEKSAFPVSAGEAFFMNADSKMEFDNAFESDAVYIVASGHRASQERTSGTPSHAVSSTGETTGAGASAGRSAQQVALPPLPDDEFEITKDDPSCDDDDDGGRA